MSKFKHAALALATVGLLSAQVHAGEAQAESLQALPVAAFSQTDINAMFEQVGQPMQLAALSLNEMKETEGAVIWFAPVALGGARFALTGFTRHGLNQVISRDGFGVSNRAILSTLRNPTTVYSRISDRTVQFVRPDSRVVLSQSGRLITAWGSRR